MTKSLKTGRVGRMNLHMARYTHGQSMTEYLIVCAAIAAAMGVFMADGSLYKEFAQAISEGYSKFSYAISLVL